MKEKLIIKNFGPIKSVEIELRMFNVLIGDQGTGKSTIAKVLIAIQSTVLREISSLGWAKENSNTKTESFKEYLRITG
ncbi:MAG: AAA family ATPase, partial [Ginsengibacter sp.]